MLFVKTSTPGFALALALCTAPAWAVSPDAPESVNAAAAQPAETASNAAPEDKADKQDGPDIGATFTSVWQKAHGLPQGTDDAGDQLSNRLDLTVDAPLPAIGDVTHKLFAHVRAGQGPGVNQPLERLGYFSVPNSAAFSAVNGNTHAPAAVLGEAWYQATVPLGSDARKLELSAGKLDPFGFFDLDEVANNETVQFINSLFVHNPLLDAGGEIAVDAHGFQPGLVAAYRDTSSASGPWRLALGVLGAQDNQQGFSAPLLMAEIDKTIKIFDDREGNYRFYVWTRHHAPDFTGGYSRHTGFGLALDQQVGEGIKLFGRYGQMVSGRLPFDRALMLGGEVGGGRWGRPDDALGIAGAWLRPSAAYRNAGGEGYLTGGSQDASAPDFTFTPSGIEQTAEIYYRFQFSPHFQISPDFQWIRHGGANPGAGNVSIIGVRINIQY